MNCKMVKYVLKYYFVLGCFLLSGVPVIVQNISECYQICFDALHNEFENFAFKVKRYGMLS